MAPSFGELRQEMNRLGDQEEKLNARIAKFDQEIESLRSLTAGREQERKAAQLELKELQKEMAGLLGSSDGTTAKTAATIKQMHTSATRGGSNSKTKREVVTRKLQSMGDILHRNYPTVILIGGDPTAIACAMCGANTATTRRCFFDGVAGLKKHIVKRHRTGPLTTDNVVTICQKTDIRIADRRLIEAGRHPLTPIQNVYSGTGPDGQPQASFAQTAPSAISDRITPSEIVDKVWPIHANYASVVSIDGTWVAISCHVCGANAAGRKNGVCFFNGIHGLIGHVKAAHKGACATFDYASVLAVCLRQEIAPADAQRMQTGEIISGTVEKTVMPERSIAISRPGNHGDEDETVHVTPSRKRTASVFDRGDEIKPKPVHSADGSTQIVVPVTPPPGLRRSTHPTFQHQFKTEMPTDIERPAKQPRHDPYTTYLGHDTGAAVPAVKKEDHGAGATEVWRDMNTGSRSD